MASATVYVRRRAVISFLRNFPFCCFALQVVLTHAAYGGDFLDLDTRVSTVANAGLVASAVYRFAGTSAWVPVGGLGNSYGPVNFIFSS
jgi:hypothetical protein